MVKMNRELKNVFAIAFTLALILSSAIGLTIAIVLTDGAKSDSVAASRLSCARGNERSSVIREFIRTDAQLRARQDGLTNDAGYKQLIAKIGGTSVIARLAAQNRKFELDTINYWEGSGPYVKTGLLPRLKIVDSVSCNRAFR